MTAYRTATLQALYHTGQRDAIRSPPTCHLRR
nr:MAG TPA: hypothetical protein [Caudoviricetes sp.]